MVTDGNATYRGNHLAESANTESCRTAEMNVMFYTNDISI